MTRQLLETHAHLALTAGKYLAMRDWWITKAREAKKAKHADLVNLYVELARINHTSYRGALTRALRAQRLEEARREIRYLSEQRRAS